MKIMSERLWYYVRKLRIQNFLKRWLLPLNVTLVLFSLLKYKSHVPQFLSRYSFNFLFLLVTIGVWAILCWRISFKNNLVYQRLVNYRLIFFIINLMVITLAVVSMFNLFPDFMNRALNSMRIFPLTCLLAFALIITVPFLSTRDLRESVLTVITIAGSTIMVLILAEMFFRFMLLEHKVPTTEREYAKWISSSWPRTVPVERKDSDTFRILGLADSFGRAGGDKNFYYLLEEELQKKNLKSEIVNLSCSEYEPPDELLVFRRFGARYRADLVIHSFFVGNDFSVPKGTLLNYSGISVRPQSLSLLLQWLNRYKKVKLAQIAQQAEVDNHEETGTFSLDVFLKVELDRLRVCRIRLDQRERMKWQKILQILDQIRDEVNRSGAKYIIVIHPDQYQVEDALYHQIIQSYDLDIDDYDLKAPQKFLIDYCTDRGIPCLDLLDIFRKHGSKGGLYLFRDTHYNEKGNILAANAIYSFLRDNDLLFIKNSSLEQARR